jgi:hypothetical protein
MATETVLSKAINKTIIEVIHSGFFGIIGEGITNWTSHDASILRAIVYSGVISRQQLRDEVHKFVCDFVRKKYDGNYYTHNAVSCAFPFALAYAIKHKVISIKEARRIKFDHGDNRETFIYEFYQENFCDKLVKQLLGE